MLKKSTKGSLLIVSATLLAGSLIPCKALAQTTQSAPKPATQTAQPAAATSHSRYQPSRFPKRAVEYYGMVWGVDSLQVKLAESGEVVKFTYHVLDGDKAKVLNDKKNEPSLIDPQARVKLVVPSLEKVGQLRQSATPEAGKVYWMAFSNKGRHVKHGDRVVVVIGQFRADGLVVD
jgi:hypothetical protein